MWFKGILQWMANRGLPQQDIKLNATAVQTIEALWMLVWTSVHIYKTIYESETSTTKQAAVGPNFTSGLTPAGARIKRAMKKRFKMMDDHEWFEVHRGEWVRTDSPVAFLDQPKGDAKGGTQAPDLEAGTTRHEPQGRRSQYGL